MKNKQLDQIFAALSDSTRRAILKKLAQGGASVSELAKPFKMSQPAISKHLKVLESAGFISTQVDGQRRLKELKTEPMTQAMSWIEQSRQVDEQSFGRLDFLLQQLKQSASQNKSDKKYKPIKVEAQA